MKNIKLTKSQQKQIKNKLKKVKPVYWLLIFVFLVIGIAIGYFTITQLTKNDKIELNGNKTISYSQNSGITTYVDEGVTAIVFGQQIDNNNIKIESDLSKNSNGEFIIDLTTEDVHYIKYTISHFSFGEVVKYRTIIVEASNG